VQKNRTFRFFISTFLPQTSDYWKSYEHIIPKEKTCTIEKGNFHGRRIQQFVQTLSGKIETEI